MATRPRTTPIRGTDLPEQLSLLVHSDAPVQFRLDERTRRRGLEQIARIRRQLAVQAARRSGEPTSIVRRPSGQPTTLRKPTGRAA
jgi:hypothetical protein